MRHATPEGVAGFEGPEAHGTPVAEAPPVAATGMGSQNLLSPARPRATIFFRRIPPPSHSGYTMALPERAAASARHRAGKIFRRIPPSRSGYTMAPP